MEEETITGMMALEGEEGRWLYRNRLGGWQKRSLLGTGWEESLVTKEHGLPEPVKGPVTPQILLWPVYDLGIFFWIFFLGF